ncbi:MAG: AGE family epimerase/isomerase [Candidatus Latescibacteria bacterium]|nr:AGE family epimerase/isomerase [Candidatus Latescibacterota bacterium]
MHRRSFLGSLAAQSLLLTGTPYLWAMGEKQNGENYGVTTESSTKVTELAGMSLEEMRDFHLKDLWEGYMPYWDGTIRVDEKYGGFMPYLKEDGTHVDTIKRMYYQGRGIWVFSYLYNHFGKEKRFLEVARKGIDFIYKHCRDENGYWLSEVTREGKYLRPSENIYGDMYVAMGLGEYYEGTGDEKAREVCIDTCHKVTERIVSAEYMHLGGHGAGNEPGTKRLGTWQHFLSALTPIARQTDDYGVKMMARMCVINILERHWHPELGVCFEQLDDQFQPYRPDPTRNNRAISGWHSIQAAWMCMDDALRTGHKANFMTALEMGRQSLEKCWVDGKDGGESGLDSISNPEAKPSITSRYSAWGALDDAMVFTLLAIEHTHAPWAMHWYKKVFETSYSHKERMIREGLLHHPRRLFLAPQIIGRMIERGGKVSNFCDT